jgi:hypothetical protein
LRLAGPPGSRTIPDSVGRQLVHGEHRIAGTVSRQARPTGMSQHSLPDLIQRIDVKGPNDGRGAGTRHRRLRGPVRVSDRGLAAHHHYQDLSGRCSGQETSPPRIPVIVTCDSVPVNADAPRPQYARFPRPDATAGRRPGLGVHHDMEVNRLPGSGGSVL